MGQENANLQQQIVQITSEREEEVLELRKYLHDSSNYGSHPNLNSSFIGPYSSTRRNSETNCIPDGDPEALANTDTGTNPIVPSANTTGTGLSSSIAFSSFNRSAASSICKRCSEEIQLLNLVNSIEPDENMYDWEFGSPDDDNMEYSSLEHELAKATGTPYRRDNRFSEEFHHSMRTVPNSGAFSYSNRRNSMDNCHFLNNSPKKGTPPQGNTEMNQMETSSDDIGSSDERMDEDPCLIKDRKPEFAKNKNKVKSKKMPQRKLSSSSSSEDKSHKAFKTTSITANANAKSSGVVRNSKFLALPKRIPSEDEESDDDDNFGKNMALVSSAVGKQGYQTENSVDVIDSAGKMDKVEDEEPASLIVSSQFLYVGCKYFCVECGNKRIVLGVIT